MEQEIELQSVWERDREKEREKREKCVLLGGKNRERSVFFFWTQRIDISLPSRQTLFLIASLCENQVSAVSWSSIFLTNTRCKGTYGFVSSGTTMVIISPVGNLPQTLSAVGSCPTNLHAFGIFFMVEEKKKLMEKEKCSNLLISVQSSVALLTTLTGVLPNKSGMTGGYISNADTPSKLVMRMSVSTGKVALDSRWTNCVVQWWAMSKFKNHTAFLSFKCACFLKKYVGSFGIFFFF